MARNTARGVCFLLGRRYFAGGTTRIVLLLVGTCTTRDPASHDYGVMPLLPGITINNAKA